ncbi:MAG: hypothetical protein K1X94_32510 [Sandaracinaceae bacterium]|nr:hypothetical protein [Sandaracinaceae bacterium]
MTRIVLDAGAFIALDRSDRAMWGRFALARRRGEQLLTHGGVVAQVFRGTARQARLALALAAVEVAPLDDLLGRTAGRLLGKSGTSDAIDAALVSIARDGDRILTSDPDDIAALASAARLEVDVVRV